MYSKMVEQFINFQTDLHSEKSYFCMPKIPHMEFGYGQFDGPFFRFDFTNGMGDDEYEPRTCLNAILSVVCAHVEINNVFNMCHVLVTK